MIILDIETSGVDFSKCGIWQIGAIDLESGEEFLQECRIDDKDEIVNAKDAKHPVLEVIGKTEEELRDIKKQSQKELLENLFNWLEQRADRRILCHHPQFDMGFILTKARKYNLNIFFSHKTFDLYTLAELRYFQFNNKFSKEHGFKTFGLTEISEFCGLEDKRKFHNALEDCKLEAECFYRLVYGKNLFKEYAKFEIPNYLKNDNL